MAKKHTLAHWFAQIFPDEPSNYRGNPSVLTSLANLGHYKESLRLGLEMGLEVNLEGVIKHGKLRNLPQNAGFLQLGRSYSLHIHDFCSHVWWRFLYPEKLDGEIDSSNLPMDCGESGQPLVFYGFPLWGDPIFLENKDQQDAKATPLEVKKGKFLNRMVAIQPAKFLFTLVIKYRYFTRLLYSNTCDSFGGYLPVSSNNPNWRIPYPVWWFSQLETSTYSYLEFIFPGKKPSIGNFPLTTSISSGFPSKNLPSLGFLHLDMSHGSIPSRWPR